MTKVIIAIDGPAAGGKGTIARGLAAALGYAHLETGLLYRYVGKEWLSRGQGNLDQAAEIAQNFAKNFSKKMITALSNDQELRTNPVAEAAAVTSAHPPVRAALLELQREFARNPPGGAKGAILDGRDIATIICPDANVKLFVTASPEIRAARRTKELQLMGQAVTYEQVLSDVRQRDIRDETRAIAPLKATVGSDIIDTSNLSAQESIGFALRVIHRTIPNIT